MLRDRLAPAHDLGAVFSTTAFPIYVWSILNMLHKVPAWLMQFSVWDMIGIVAYIQVFALVETIAVFLALVLLGAVLPRPLFRERFVAQASVLVLMSAASVALVRLNNLIVPTTGQGRDMAFAIYMGSVVLLYVVSLVVLTVLIRRHKKLEDAICAAANRLTVLAFVYVTTSLLSVLVVILRNV